MPPGSSHVSFAELQRAAHLDASLLWALLHQTASTLRHLLSKDPSTWETGPNLLLTPDSVLLYSSGSVLFCNGTLDDPTSGFSPPELAMASPHWTKVTAEKAYLYSLGHTLLQGVESTEDKEGYGPLLSLLAELTAISPFDRPPLAQVLRACKQHSSSPKPQVVLGAAVRRAAGHSSTDSLVSFSSGEVSLGSSISSLASAGSGDTPFLRRLSKETHKGLTALSGCEWLSAENLLQQKGRVRSAPPRECPVRRCSSFNDYYSQSGVQHSTSSASAGGPNPPMSAGQGAATMLCTPHDQLPPPRPLSMSTSHDPLPLASSRTIPHRGSVSMERVDSLFSSYKRRSSQDFVIGSEPVDVFAVYSPRQEDIAAAERELQKEEVDGDGQQERTSTASEEWTTPMEVGTEERLLSLPCAQTELTPPTPVDTDKQPLPASKTDHQGSSPLRPAEQADHLHPAEQVEVNEGLCGNSMEGEGSVATPPHKGTQGLKVQFVLEREGKDEECPAEPCATPSESGLPAGWLMSPEECSSSGGMAFTLWAPCSTPPPPRAPPPLFTPYKPGVEASYDDTTFDHSTTGALDQSRDSQREEDLESVGPPLPSCSPPLLTPTKVDMDVPDWRMDETDGRGLEPRSEMDLSAVLEEAFHDLSRPSSELAGAKEENTQAMAEHSTEQSHEVDMLSAGIYSEVFQGKMAEGHASHRPKWRVTPKFDETSADGDYAIPADSLSRKRDSSDAPEGYVAYATVDRETKTTRHLTVKSLDRNASLPAEAADGDRRTSTTSDESPYAAVRSGDSEQVTSDGVKHVSVQAGSNGATAKDSSKSNKDKLGWILGPDFSRLHKSTSVILPNKTLPALGRGRRVVTVILLNERKMEVMVECDSLCREVHSQVAAALSLDEPYLYGLAVIKGSEEYFLELQKKLAKYAPKGWAKKEAPPPGVRTPHEQPPEFIVMFRVQYYLNRDMFKKVSQSARLQLYLQLRRDFLCAGLLAPVGVSVRLGAMLGVVEGTGLQDSLPSYLLHKDSIALLQQQVGAVRDTLASLTREEVRAEFLKEASTLEDYGKMFYALAKDKSTPLGDYFIGFGTEGVTIHNLKNNERTVLGDFSWRQLDKIFFQNHKLEFEPHESHPHAFYAGSHKRARYLWNLSVLLHRFSLYMRSRRMRRDSTYEQLPVDTEVRLVKLLKRPGQGVGVRLGSSARGVFVKQVHKNAPADMDGELEPGDRVLSVNGQTVRHHQQASELIRSGPMVVSLLVEKADRAVPPDLSELETSMDGGQLTSQLATSIMEQTIPEEPDEGEGDQGGPHPLNYTVSQATPLEVDSSPCPGNPQMVSVELAPKASPRTEEEGEEDERKEEEEEEEGEGEEGEGEEGEEEGEEEEVVKGDEKAGEEVDASPAETVVTITRHPQKNTFGIKFEVRGRDVRVKSIEPGCPTALSGQLQVGQLVLSVEGTPVRGRPLMQVMDLLGHCGASADLVVGGASADLIVGGAPGAD